MKKINKTISFALLSLIIVLGAGIQVTSSAQDGEKVFELRIYTIMPEHLDDLHARFRDHTTRLIRKHGMVIVGYWSPDIEQEADDTSSPSGHNQLVYLLEHESREAADASWSAFDQDPEWAPVRTVPPRDSFTIENYFMTATDYSPMK